MWVDSKGCWTKPQKLILLSAKGFTDRVWAQKASSPQEREGWVGDGAAAISCRALHCLLGICFWLQTEVAILTFLAHGVKLTFSSP